MNTPGDGNHAFSSIFRQVRPQRGLVFGILIVAALLAFEVFNYSTTDYALGDILGGLSFAGVAWSTILAIAFCGIDFAGIARLFTPQDGANETTETWYLFGAWMLAATMNAMLTWWGVSLAIVGHTSNSGAVIDRATLLKVVPIFVALMVWVIRVLIIGTFSVAGERLFSQGSVRAQAPRISPLNRPATNFRRTSEPVSSRPASVAAAPSSRPAATPVFRPAARPAVTQDPPSNRSEPTYHPVTMNGSSNNNPSNNRRQL